MAANGMNSLSEWLFGVTMTGQGRRPACPTVEPSTDGRAQAPCGVSSGRNPVPAAAHRRNPSHIGYFVENNGARLFVFNPARFAPFTAITGATGIWDTTAAAALHHRKRRPPPRFRQDALGVLGPRMERTPSSVRSQRSAPRPSLASSLPGNRMGQPQNKQRHRHSSLVEPEPQPE